MAEQANLELESKERVAYDLMTRISQAESSHNKDKWLKPDPRTYFLQLFNQCIRAADQTNKMPNILGND